MCGRLVRTSPAEALAREFVVKRFADVDLRPRYNLCPGELVPAIIDDGEGRVLGPLHWGIPSEGRSGGKGAAINVRSETASRHPEYRDAFRKRRCLIPADGFYEWRKEGRRRIPYLVRFRSGAPFALAGLWQRSALASGKPIYACTILTCAPNEVVSGIHDRMPVVLGSGARDRWLARTEPAAELEALLRPYPPEEMEIYEVSPLVNSPRNDSPECVEKAR